MESDDPDGELFQVVADRLRKLGEAFEAAAFSLADAIDRLSVALPPDAEEERIIDGDAE